MAFGILNPIIEWTDETFNRKFNSQETKDSIDNNNSANVETIYKNYDDIEKSFGIPIYKPAYLMDNYELEMFDYVESVPQVDFFARYKNDETVVPYDIIVYKPTNTYFDQKIEKISGEPEIFSYENLDFYIMQNENWYLVTWDYFGVTYTLAGFTSRDEVIEFIKNLKK